LSETKVFENPLIPNKRMRELFVAMVEMRVLDEHVAGLRRGVKARRRMVSTRGEEACRVSMAIGLEAGDLVSDAAAGVAIGLVAGVGVGTLLRRVGRGSSSSKATDVAARREMPWIEDVEDRLRMAIGAALSFKVLQRANVVVAFVREGEVSKGAWRRMLGLAAKLELPIVFVVLPQALGKKAKRRGVGDLCGLARGCGVPGIPVDASDAVALYRVAQESMGRLRGGDGPVLVECVAFRAEGKRGGVVDPLELMRGFLVGRRVCSAAWMDRAGDAARRRIAAAAGKAGGGA
jgi:TPP-dependent pyruvate/acetoin dehydrogenase alpha subunit